MKYIVLIIFFTSLLSCRKTLCNIKRYDLGSYFKAKRASDSFYIDIWYIPHPRDLQLSQKVLDSFEILKNKGYSITQLIEFRYGYVNCSDCEYLKVNNINCDCRENDY